jgi:hypothetical protein
VKKGRNMFVDDEDDEILDFVGNTTEEVEEETPAAEEVKEEAEGKAEETNDEETEEVSEEESEGESEEETEEEPKKDSIHQALDSERSRRKQAEKELKELRAKLDAEKNAKDEEEQLSKEREAYKKKMLEGDLVDEEVADKLLDVFGEDLIKTKLANNRRTEEENFEKQFNELKQDELFMDADVYKSKIRELTDKGLSMEEAYFASVGKGRFTQMKKDMEVELEQKLLNNEKKADKVDVGHVEAKSEPKKGHYTKREQEIARETGMDVEEVHKRLGLTTIEDFVNL